MKLPIIGQFPAAEKDPPRPDKRETFGQRCSELTERLREIRVQFDMAEDEDTIDALIYEENAVLCRLAQLYKQARAEGISLEHFER